MTNFENESLYNSVYDRLELNLQMLEALVKELRGFSQSYERKRDMKIEANMSKLDTMVLSELIEALSSSKNVEKILKNETESDIIPYMVEDKLMQSIPVSFQFDVFIREMSLVYLIAEFESFLANILRDTFNAKPQALASAKKCLTNEEVVKSINIKEIKNAVIEREIAETLRLDIGDIGQYFEQKLKINISTLPKWILIKERFYRRNLLLHNSSIINDIYRQKTGYKGSTIRIIVSEEYLSESIEIFRVFGRNILVKFRLKFMK
jgi:hypothetical protein